MQIPRRVSGLLSRTLVESSAAYALVRAGAVGVQPPQDLLREALALRAYGPAGAAFSLAALRYGDAAGLIDDRGRIGYRELDLRANAIANGLVALGVRPDDCVAVLCRNHRGMFEALAATAKLGSRTLLLNTDFSAVQLADVCRREGVALVIADSEFAELTAASRTRLGTVSSPGGLDDLAASHAPTAPPRPARAQQIVLLTSGTTGTPKGAPREFGMSLAIPGGYLSKIPLRSGRHVIVAAPIFHAWGLLSTMIAVALGDSIVVRRRFEPADLLAAISEHSADALVTVPIVLSRLVDLGAARRTGYDLGSLRVLAVSGSALSAELATRALHAFGPVLYNLYGSTEVAYATIATPQDLLAAPGCVGRAPIGTTVRLLDADGTEVADGQRGRIFVGSSIQFAGYTDGQAKETVGSLMSTGDIGHLDSAGRLFVDGRDDDMIISGGENVFPAEIEALLNDHPRIVEAAVVGVTDPDFGQRLRAYVVLDDGRPKLTADEIADYVRSNLARFKVPREVIFIERLPRNPAGKIVKHQLPPD